MGGGMLLANNIGNAMSTPLPGAGGIFYTKGSPGRWSSKTASHLPQLSVITDNSGNKILNVVTPHTMNGYQHYIVKHVVLDADFKFAGENIFDPMTQKAESQFNINQYKGVVYVLSVCNLHDTWLNAMRV